MAKVLPALRTPRGALNVKMGGGARIRCRLSLRAGGGRGRHPETGKQKKRGRQPGKGSHGGRRMGFGEASKKEWEGQWSRGGLATRRQGPDENGHPTKRTSSEMEEKKIRSQALISLNLKVKRWN